MALLLLPLLLAAGILAAGVYLGQQQAYSRMGIDPQRYRAMAEALPEAQAHIEELKRQLAAADIRHEVDRASLELVRQDLAHQQEQLAELAEGLRFYRSLMAPGDIAQGFSLRGIELVPRDTLGRYAYRIVVQQEARKHDTVRGDLQVYVQGIEGGESLRYELAEITADLESNQIPLRFRYFQAIEGELDLPEGFQPQTIDVEAKLSSPRKLVIEQRYPWQVLDKFTHVGK